jgi:O-antigen/teichoic acid export membrane protein
LSLEEDRWVTLQASTRMLRDLQGRLAGDGLRAVLVRSMLGTAGIQAACMALAFLLGIQLTRGLGAHGYGVYAFAMSAAALLGIPSEFGLPILVIREVVAARSRQAWERLKGLMIFGSGAVLVTSLAIALLGELVMSLGGFGASAERRAALRWGFLLIPVVAQVKLFGATLQGLGRIVLGQVANLIMRPGIFALLLLGASVLAHGRLTAPYAMALQVTGAFCALLFAFGLCAGSLPLRVSSAQADYDARAWLFAATPMAMTEGLRVLHGNLAVLLLGLMSSTTETALFKVADSTALICQTPASMMNLIAASLAARFWVEGDRERLQRLAFTLAIAMPLGVAFLTAPVLVGGPWLLGLVFGPAFRGAYPALAVISTGYVVLAAFGIPSVLLNMTGGEARVFRALRFCVITSAIADLVLIPRLGGIGAAVGGLLGGFVWNLVLWRDCLELRGVNTSLVGIWRIRRIARSEAP